MRRSVDEIAKDSEIKRPEILSELHSLKLPEELIFFIDKYEKIEWHRHRFLWSWVWRLVYAQSPGFMLSSVPENYRKEAALAKAYLVMATTIVDDVSDKLHDEQLLNILLKVPFETVDFPTNLHDSKSLSIQLVVELLEAFNGLLKNGENWNSVKKILDYDMKQVWNCFAYSDLLNSCPDIINHTENSIYNSHNMVLYIFGDVDLVYSPVLGWKTELPHLRELFWHAQQMLRIGNWVSTWERELNEKDISSGIISWGVSNQALSIRDVFSSEKKDVRTRIEKAGIEAKLLHLWEASRQAALQVGRNIHSVDMEHYIDGLELVMLYHLASRGFK